MFYFGQDYINSKTFIHPVNSHFSCPKMFFFPEVGQIPHSMVSSLIQEYSASLTPDSYSHYISSSYLTCGHAPH